MNKTCAKDLEWSVALYRSWLNWHAAGLRWARFHASRIPFALVVPRADEALFRARFRDANTRFRPVIISEERLFETAQIDVPADFSGWHRQQLVKLGFSKVGFAQSYITFDSAIVLSGRLPFNDIIKANSIATSAGPVRKSDYYSSVAGHEAKGWLDGGLANLERCYERISEIVGNTSNDTNMYISGICLFDSDLSRDLEIYARERGLDGYVGCLRVAPYECSWYGEFVFTRHRARFDPFGPHMLALVESPASAAAFLARTLEIGDDKVGVMVQPPASAIVAPEQALKLLTS